MAPELTVKSRDEDGTTVLVLNGELSLAEAPTLERRLSEAISAARSTIVVDLAGVEFIDSTGLSVLVRAQQQAVERGIELGVVNATAQATRLLTLTGLAERLTLAGQPAAKPPGSED